MVHDTAVAPCETGGRQDGFSLAHASISPSVMRCCNVYVSVIGRTEQYYAQHVVRETATICRRPCKLTVDLLSLKVVSESRVTWANSMPILVFLGLSVLDLGPKYVTDRQTDVRRASSLNVPYPRAGA